MTQSLWCVALLAGATITGTVVPGDVPTCVGRCRASHCCQSAPSPCAKPCCEQQPVAPEQARMSGEKVPKICGDPGIAGFALRTTGPERLNAWLSHAAADCVPASGSPSLVTQHIRLQV